MSLVRYRILLYRSRVHIITQTRIKDAAKRWPHCSSALWAWLRIMRGSRFADFAELKASFGSVDKVGNLYVFDVGGNKLRLIAAIHFNSGRVFVRHILTHREYDKNAWKSQERIK